VASQAGRQKGATRKVIDAMFAGIVEETEDGKRVTCPTLASSW